MRRLPLDEEPCIHSSSGHGKAGLSFWSVVTTLEAGDDGSCTAASGKSCGASASLPASAKRPSAANTLVELTTGSVAPPPDLSETLTDDKEGLVVVTLVGDTETIGSVDETGAADSVDGAKGAADSVDDAAGAGSVIAIFGLSVGWSVEIRCQPMPMANNTTAAAATLLPHNAATLVLRRGPRAFSSSPQSTSGAG